MANIKFKIYFNIIIPRVLKSYRGFPSDFPLKIIYAYVFPIYVTSHN